MVWESRFEDVSTWRERRNDDAPSALTSAAMKRECEGMGIFSSIKNKIFGSGEAQAAEAAPTAKPTVTQASAAPSAAPAPAAPAPAAPAAPAPTAAPAPQATVDVAAVLSGLAAKSGQKLDWKKSIVDLLKLLDIDSSLANRKELASELGYTGDTNDSATMNIWLHKAVMKQLAEHGGKVPDELRD
jgi:3-oxoacyl-ACP reductase-like protein